MSNRSCPITFHHVENARDLGGMVTADGRRIKSGLLIRSGKLFDADAEDTVKLNSYGIRKVIDFRSRREVTETPDVPLENAVHIHIPIMRERNIAIERTKEAPKGSGNFMVDMQLRDPEAGIHFMTKCYGDFVRDEYQVQQYGKFVREVINTPDGAVLWHCAGGKDRAGFGSIILQAILGVDRESIIEDYLFTNELNQKDIEGMREKAARAEIPAWMDRAAFTEGMLQFCYAKPEYIGAMFGAADELYGSFENFLKEGLGITDEDRKLLQDRYLES